MSVVMYREAIRDALREEMIRDPNVFLIGEDLRDPWGGTYKATQGLSTELGDDKVLNTPIAESAIIGMSLGCALTGLRPVAELMYLDFAPMAMDQIINQVCKIRYMTGGQVEVPLVIRAQGGGGRSSAAQHGQSLEAWFAHIPGMYVVIPATPYDAKGLLKTAIRTNDPVMFIEHKMLYTTKGEVPEEDYAIPFGVADVKRVGDHVTIVANSRMVLVALDAAEELAREGISAEVIDPRTIVPLDIKTIVESVQKTGRLIVVHEAHERAGWGAEVSSLVQERAFEYLDRPVVRLAGRNVPLPMAPQMERFVLPQQEDIVQAAKRLVS